VISKRNAAPAEFHERWCALDSKQLTQILRTSAKPLIEGLYPELRSNLGTSHYHRLSNEELFQRTQTVYERLADWLSDSDEAAVLRSGEELGKQRFSQGIPLGQVVLALILVEKHLWDHVSQFGPAEELLRRSVGEFFQKMIYSTARGYEYFLAESNRRPRKAMAPSATPPSAAIPKPAAAPEERELGVSRGGEVGEHGG
jgi:hypothetical protein